MDDLGVKSDQSRGFPRVARFSNLERPISYGEHLVLRGHDAQVTSADFSFDNMFLASASVDKCVKVWSVNDGMHELDFLGHDGPVTEVVWGADNRTVVTSSDDRTVRVWDVTTRKCIRVYEGHAAEVYCVAMSPSGNVIASGSMDESIRYWDMRVRESVRIVPAHAAPISSVSFNGDGTSLVSSSFDGLCRVWDITTNQCYTTLLSGLDGSSGCAMFSGSSKLILQGVTCSNLVLWDFTCSEIVGNYTGHVNNSLAVKCAFVGLHHAISASEDGVLYLWDLCSPKPMQRIKVSNNLFIACAASKNAKYIAAGEANFGPSSVRVLKKVL